MSVPLNLHEFTIDHSFGIGFLFLFVWSLYANTAIHENKNIRKNNHLIKGIEPFLGPTWRLGSVVMHVAQTYPLVVWSVFRTFPRGMCQRFGDVYYQLQGKDNIFIQYINKYKYIYIYILYTYLYILYMYHICTLWL